MKQLSGSAKAGLIAAVLGVAGIAGMGAAAFAGETKNSHAGMSMAGEEENDAAEEAREAQALAQIKVRAGDAANAAEQHTGMKASEVELDDEAATPVWEISVAGNGGEKTVMVDGISGQVKSVSADDGEGAEGREDAD